MHPLPLAHGHDGDVTATCQFHDGTGHGSQAWARRPAPRAPGPDQITLWSGP
ncbi:hypothetical protein roselon_01693 [Roseibacterium elongatum DSM 19469]|uniref:Uncharacterized protein n=1 Tax=Roseicyclus elongatus DSM 19469 TaxID=1294273 RepID=W8SNG2_9RHOB|nr:hypothetical protein roselon_01693 [Roseibacterium elongatum DSM 19469]